ncbi:MAG: hypothetical protein JO165_05470 [Candidatus Eremiobacteraeota bacterium]|nr:hypothetical protein [Candidatus Eremiobacteraeota bacterium]
MRLVRALAAGIVLTALPGLAAPGSPARLGTFALDVPGGPYFPGSAIRVNARGTSEPFGLSVLGPGSVTGSVLRVPDVDTATSATLIGSLPGAIATASIALAPAPKIEPTIAVASYDNGIAFHDPKTFKISGFVGAAFPVGDVAFAADGRVFAPDTDGTTMLEVRRTPWSVASIPNVLLGNEVLHDDAMDVTYVSNRDAPGGGTVTRIARDGTVRTARTGETPEGLALGEQEHRLYVGNVNDNSVSVVDTTTFSVVKRIPAVERVFGIALDEPGLRLFVVSNTTRTARSNGGFVAEIDLRAATPRVIRRSAPMRFPLGVAYDAQHSTLFVTDEAADLVYVVDPGTLGIRRRLRTCKTPWRPHVAGDRLYVPCARDASVDVFALPTLHRIHGAPFATGGTPLGVATFSAR